MIQYTPPYTSSGIVQNFEKQHYYATNYQSSLDLFGGMDFDDDVSSSSGDVVTTAISTDHSGVPTSDVFSTYGISNTGGLPASGSTNDISLLPDAEAVSGTYIKADFTNSPGEYVVAWNNINFTNSQNGTDLKDWVMSKLDANKNVLWLSNFTGGRDENQYEEVHDVCIDKNDVYYACGRRIDVTNSKFGGLVTSVDPTFGTVNWQKQYTISGMTMELYCISFQTQANELIVSGTVTSSNGAGPSFIIVMGLNPANGTVLWKTMNSSSYGSMRGYRHFINPSDQSIIVVGQITDATTGVRSGCAAKYFNPDLTRDTNCTGSPGRLSWIFKYSLFSTDVHGTPVAQDMSLYDVCERIINNDNTNFTTSHPSDDFAATGWGDLYHNSNLTRDVLVLETENTGSSGQATSVGGLTSCKCVQDGRNCEYHDIDELSLDPIVASPHDDGSTEISQNSDRDPRTCSDVDDYSNNARPKEMPQSEKYSDQYDCDKIFPNPNYGCNALKLETTLVGNIQIAIYDQVGSEVVSFSVRKSTLNGLVTIPSFLASPGVYSIVVTGDNEKHCLQYVKIK